VNGLFLWVMTLIVYVPAGTNEVNPLPEPATYEQVVVPVVPPETVVQQAVLPVLLGIEIVTVATAFGLIVGPIPAPPDDVHATSCQMSLLESVT
jgi:hypothetical protein